MHNFKVGDIIKKITGVRAGYIGLIKDIRGDYISGIVITEHKTISGEQLKKGDFFGDNSDFFVLESVYVFNNKLDKIINE